MERVYDKLVANTKRRVGLLKVPHQGRGRPITAMISASAIQLHRNCKVVIDEEAARELKEREYYDWICQKEPEWQEFRA
jgi:hypothetical protein